MRISDWSSDVCSSDLAARATNASQLPEGQDYFYLGRANTDLVSGRGSTTVELYRITGGLEGDFNIGDRNFKWEVIGNYGRSKTRGSRSEEHTSELQSLMRISYAVFCL